MDTALRTTTLRVGTARGHCRLDQMSSLPEVILSVSVSGETSQVHASAWMVRSSSTRKTSRPATAFGTVGVTAMSSSAQEPVGAARTGSLRFFFFGCLPSARCRVVAVALGGQRGRRHAGDRRGGVRRRGGVAARVEHRASTNTSSTARATSRTRRRQYTRGGRGPRVREVMAQR